MVHNGVWFVRLQELQTPALITENDYKRRAGLWWLAMIN